MESSTAGDVQIVSRRLVRPEPASSPDKPPEVIHLTPWDLTLITLDQIQKGILLPKPQTTGGAVLADELASSLARTLGRFYPLAGRLAASEITGGESESAEPGPCLAISLRCTGEGAEFIHAVAPGVTVSDIVTPLYTPPVVSSSFFPLNRLLNVEAVVGSLPVLAAQVTELADGVFVAVSLNHGVTDGTTFWHLLNAWSEINRRRRRGSGSESEGFELSTPPPVMDRWFVDACPVPVPLPHQFFSSGHGLRTVFTEVEPVGDGAAAAPSPARPGLPPVQGSAAGCGRGQAASQRSSMSSSQRCSALWC